MRWVSRNFVHFDRVVTPWLILRFVDPEAEFILLPWGSENDRPPDAIPYAIPGVELADHDADATTFDRVMVKYKLDHPGLKTMARVIRYGVHNTLFGAPYPDDRAGRIGEGVFAAIEGIMLSSATDLETIERALPVLDGLFALFSADAAMDARDDATPPTGVSPAMWRTTFIAATVVNVRKFGHSYDGRTPVMQDDAFNATLGTMRANLDNSHLQGKA
jgi:hypothetical protein